MLLRKKNATSCKINTIVLIKNAEVLSCEAEVLMRIAIACKKNVNSCKIFAIVLMKKTEVFRQKAEVFMK